LKWIRLVRHYINKKRKDRAEGGGHVYLLAIYLVIFMLVLFKIMWDRERVYVTYDMVDDSIVSSLISSCVCNLEEFGVSNQLVIYRSLTPVKIPSIFDDMFGDSEEEETEGEEGEEEEEEEYDPLNDPEILNPGWDPYLENCYEKFENNLKHNLKLDDAMNATISGIDGLVTINEFSVYNVYRSFDDSGNETGYRVVRYTKTGSGTWSVFPYGLNTPVSVYNSFDKTYTTIKETSVVASLTFNTVLSDYTDWLMPELAQEDMSKTVNYQRIVDITYQ